MCIEEPYVEIPPTCVGIGFGKGTYDQWRRASTNCGGNIHRGLCHCQENSHQQAPLVFSSSPVHLLGLHFRGRISLGTQYAKGTVANPNPIMI